MGVCGREAERALGCCHLPYPEGSYQFCSQPLLPCSLPCSYSSAPKQPLTTHNRNQESKHKPPEVSVTGHTECKHMFAEEEAVADGYAAKQCTEYLQKGDDFYPWQFFPC